MYPNQMAQGLYGSGSLTGSLTGYQAPMQEAMPTPESPCSQELTRLAANISELEMAVQSLGAALQPVTIPAPPAVTGSTSPAVPNAPPRGVVVDNICAASDRLYSVIATISSIRKSLTV